MSGEHLSKDPVSLEDLKRAIQAIPTHYANAPADLGGYSYQRLRAEAWRTAFEWRNKGAFHMDGDEYLAGMRLIREKLS